MLDTRAEHETKFLPSILTSRRDELFPRVAAYVRDVPVGTIEACHDGARRDPAGPAQHHTSRCRVPMALIESHGAVSEEVARAMADGALGRSDAAIAVSVTGMAGPGGGSAEKPVGLVYFGLARTGQPAISERHVLPGDRAAIRAATVASALKMIRDAL